MNNIRPKKIAIVVTNPDDETILAAGTILSHPSWQCFIISLYRRCEEECTTKFQNKLKVFKAEGIICDFDDGFVLMLNKKGIERTILELLSEQHHDLIIPHNPNGKHIRHLQHEEINKAIINLWNSGKILSDELRTFAYARWS